MKKKGKEMERRTLIGKAYFKMERRTLIGKAHFNFFWYGQGPKS